MTQLPIDLDSETIHFDGQWCTRDDLARGIKAMLDAGDYAIGRHTHALEALTQTIASLRTVGFRATPELAEALEATAAQQGKTVGGVVRDALAQYLGYAAMMEQQPVIEAMPEPQPSEPPGLTKVSGAAPAQEESVVVESGIITEAASPDEAAQAVDLTPKKDEPPAERRWFGG